MTSFTNASPLLFSLFVLWHTSFLRSLFHSNCRRPSTLSLWLSRSLSLSLFLIIAINPSSPHLYTLRKRSNLQCGHGAMLRVSPCPYIIQGSAYTVVFSSLLSFTYSTSFSVFTFLMLSFPLHSFFFFPPFSLRTTSSLLSVACLHFLFLDSMMDDDDGFQMLLIPFLPISPLFFVLPSLLSLAAPTFPCSRLLPLHLFLSSSSSSRPLLFSLFVCFAFALSWPLFYHWSVRLPAKRKESKSTMSRQRRSTHV